jgi:hypothetical protein
MPRGLPDSFIATAALKSYRGATRGPRGRGGSRFKDTYIQLDFKKIVLYKPVLNYELNAKTGMTGRHMKVLGNKIIVGARKQVGVSTGKLSASIHMAHYSSGTKQYIRVGSSVKYALMHHEGTAPHLITPHPPRTHLRFTSKKGGLVFATAVMHPGTRPNRYLSDQLRKFIRPSKREG